MSFWGVSRSDVANCGWNTVVGCGVLLACAGTAYVVKKLAVRISAQSNEQGQTIYSQTVNSQIAGAVMGLGAAFATCFFVPDSRFALIRDDSISKSLKLLVVQGIFGVIIDKIVGNKCYTAAYVGAYGATTASNGRLTLVFLGAIGAGFGSGFFEL